MEWINRIPNWIKIPLKILLPSMTIFSGFLLLASENLLKKLFLIDFRNTNGFSFGLIFLICLSLSLCYTFSFLFNLIAKKVKAYKSLKEQINTYINLADCHKKVLEEIYRRPSRSMKMSYSCAVTTYLMRINAVGMAQISSYGIWFDFFLQPWVVHAIEKTIANANKSIKTKERLLNKEKNTNKINKLKQEILEHKKYIEYINSESTDTDFDWEY